MNKHTHNVFMPLMKILIMAISAILVSCSGESVQPLQDGASMTLKGYGPLSYNGDVRFVSFDLKSDSKGRVTGFMTYSPNIDEPYELDSVVEINGVFGNKNLTIQASNLMVLNIAYVKDNTATLNGEGILLNNKARCDVSLNRDYRLGQKVYRDLLASIAQKELQLLKENQESDAKINVKDNSASDKQAQKEAISQKEENNDSKEKTQLESLKRDELKRKVNASKSRADYVLDDNKLTESMLEGLTPDKLRLMRNEIYARNGYIFASKDLRSHFNKTDWYVPYSADNKEVMKAMNSVERHNISVIQKYEKSINTKNLKESNIEKQP